MVRRMGTNYQEQIFDLSKEVKISKRFILRNIGHLNFRQNIVWVNVKLKLGPVGSIKSKSYSFTNSTIDFLALLSIVKFSLPTSLVVRHPIRQLSVRAIENRVTLPY